MFRSPWLLLAAGGLVVVAVVVYVSLRGEGTGPVDRPVATGTPVAVDKPVAIERPTRTDRPARHRTPGRSIGDLFDDDDAPWDLESIKAMTWDELGVENVDLDGDGLFAFEHKRHNARLDFSYRQIELTWGAKADTYTMLPKGERPPPDGAYATVGLKHHAFLFLPDNYPSPDLRGYGHAALYSVHEFPRSKKGGIHLRVDELGRALRAVQLYEIPVLLHGEDQNNWEQLGYTAQDDIMGSSSLATALANSGDPRILKMFYLYALVRQNLQAITLTGLALDRIEPREAPGERIGGGVLCRGSSKQGAACLRVGLVGDDRVKVLFPGRNHFLSEGGIQKYVEDWGFPRTDDHYPWIDDNGAPRGDREKLAHTVWSRLALTEWSMAAEEGEPGRVAHEIFGAHNQIDALGHIDLIAFYGQVARYKSLRWKGDRLDVYSEHDRQFPLGAESAFLDDLDPPRWRYAREKPDHDSPPRFYTRPDFNWLEAVHQLVEPDRSRWIKIDSAASSLEGRALTVRAAVAAGGVRADDRASVYYSLSEHNRCWNDWEQNGVETPGRPWHPWRSVPMTRVSDREYEACVDVENEKWSIAWYVEAERLVDESARPALRVFDSTAPRFERETPIEPRNRGCSDVGGVTIEGCDPGRPAGGDTVAVTVGLTSRRVPVHPDLPGIFLDLAVNVDLMVDGRVVDTRRVALEKASDGTRRVVLYWEIPRDGVAGEQTLTAAVDRPTDRGGRLPEFDEENNLSAPFVLTVRSR